MADNEVGHTEGPDAEVGAGADTGAEPSGLRWMTPGRAARKVGVDPRTVRRWVQLKKLGTQEYSGERCVQIQEVLRLKQEAERLRGSGGPSEYREGYAARIARLEAELDEARRARSYAEDRLTTALETLSRALPAPAPAPEPAPPARQEPAPDLSPQIEALQRQLDDAQTAFTNEVKRLRQQVVDATRRPEPAWRRWLGLKRRG